MYTLENDALKVTILDPVADRDRMGPRYCTGGYIFQVEDARHGPLLSGPTYPNSFNWFDGQGLPEAFNLGPLTDSAAGGGLSLVIGVGPCNLEDKTVSEFCVWDVEQAAANLRFLTSQEMGGYALELERVVALHGRTVHSGTRLRNCGGRPIRLCWFPHPFFPQPESGELCRLNLACTMPENPAYELGANGFICRKGWPWDDGHYQALEYKDSANLVVTQRHPSLGLVVASCQYVPTYFPIWGNANTFSWEPFLERTIHSNQELSWSVDYDF